MSKEYESWLVKVVVFIGIIINIFLHTQVTIKASFLSFEYVFTYIFIQILFLALYIVSCLTIYAIVEQINTLRG